MMNADGHVMDQTNSPQFLNLLFNMRLFSNNPSLAAKLVNELKIDLNNNADWVYHSSFFCFHPIKLTGLIGFAHFCNFILEQKLLHVPIQMGYSVC